MDCQCRSEPNAILFTLLSRGQPERPSERLPQPCRCETRRRVCLKAPDETCPLASDVLLKTLHFVKSLPAFQQLPPRDQLALLRSGWAPLFILGLAQERVAFDVQHTPAHSLLKRILLDGEPECEREQPTLAGVQTLKACLKKFWSLDLSPKEYAYLKGTVIFNPDVPGLKASLFIEGLQFEAQHALKELLLPLHPDDRGRFARILLTASTLKSITPSLVTELFFRPVIGQADLLELLTDMLFSR